MLSWDNSLTTLQAPKNLFPNFLLLTLYNVVLFHFHWIFKPSANPSCFSKTSLVWSKEFESEIRLSFMTLCILIYAIKIDKSLFGISFLNNSSYGEYPKDVSFLFRSCSQKFLVIIIFHFFYNLNWQKRLNRSKSTVHVGLLPTEHRLFGMMLNALFLICNYFKNFLRFSLATGS